ncbi:MAG TPA: response regulator [Solimonas sp.]
MNAAISNEGKELARRRRLWLPRGAVLGFALAIAAVTISGWVYYNTLQARAVTATRVHDTLEMMARLQVLLSAIKDAETAQRGFLLTGEDAYLAPMHATQDGLPEDFKHLRQLLADDVVQQQRLDVLERLVSKKMTEMYQTIALKRDGQSSRAQAIVATDEGKNLMDQIRDLFARIDVHQREVLEQREAERQISIRVSNQITLISSALLLLLIGIAVISASRDYRARSAQLWIRSGQMALASRLQGEQRLELLGDKVIGFLAEYLNAQVGTVYVAESGDRYVRVASYACDEAPEKILAGDGLIGEVCRSGRSLQVRDVPDGYLPISSSLGRGRPRELLLAPATDSGIVVGVIELGFLRAVDDTERELLDRVSELLGVAIRAARDRSRLEDFLEETQRQAEELQAQQEELRVSNEELEEQGRTLKQAQAQLEAQHAELEQTNSQLEEHMQTLESQKEVLERAQAELAQKASDLERANQYKSEFVANMSHELRTPLNSTLILSKLLGDNKDGNLTDQQVSFARTIHSAGNDLLTLINDILDLSKIEAGKLELAPAPIDIAAQLGALTTTFTPNAELKGLRLTTEIDASAPRTIVTDDLRLGQILKNLISNAIKFTERGDVSVRVYSAQTGTVSFAVRDSGIGISPAQQDIIFEAFRQADGSTLRKYGGSGLGLSISRDLAQLLGGGIGVVSAIGEGSTFTLTLPVEYRGPAAETAGARPTAELAPPPSPAAAIEPALAPATSTPRAVQDDRDSLTPQSRVILVIEDDLRFAAILRDVAQEMGFQCVLAETANEGIAAAIAYRPTAILLDMKLPDHSGLAVLDHLKRDSRTRHIPVHILSVADYSQEAMQRGAVGYALKPVQRDQLVDALRRLEEKASQKIRHVLVVEDDDRQRDSIRLLLSGENVEITAVATAAAALESLKQTVFDCMVMDISLPDISGFELLVRMVEQDGITFPPVIVYTGRSLSREEEQQLSRFSKSIIVKSARSPERLLDEVTLFIHQIESQLPAERQRMLKAVRNRDEALEGRNVLVVEDDARNILALTSVLEARGIQVQVAHNGQEALDRLARGERVDLVLMDIMMPVMDGLTAMREIRKNPKLGKLPIIALTAKAMKDDQEACRAAGANDYIAKPLDVEKLLSLLRVWMPR